MTPYEELHQLKNKREELIRINKENNMWDGLKKLLTELYPDKAHFIYELLQNAEDQNASKVQFILKQDRLIFKHNGTKRDFTIQDIDSITNIGSSTKIDDPTSIGKFGVGFKAVYAYTNTPEIHSGEFNFIIRDMLVPDDDNVEKRSQHGSTEFVFPFDNPKKPIDHAVKEIKQGLIELDENSILFLRSIKEITFVLPEFGKDGKHKMGGVKLEDIDTVTKRIIRVDAITGEREKSYWFKFAKDCSITSNNKLLNCPISIAYRMKAEKKDDKIRFTADDSLNGNVCIYFPAVKEQSNLHFHIHAPFASTVARDSIRDCPENKSLLDEIAKLVVASVYYFKQAKCIDYSFYSTMPNHRDFQYSTSPYRVIFDAVIKEFSKPTSEFYITESGEYKTLAEVLQGNRDIVKLIDSADLLNVYKKYWIPALIPQSRAETFLYELGLKTYDRKNIADAISYQLGSFMKLLASKDATWFKRLFDQLNGLSGIHAYIEKFKELKLILCQDGQLHSANDQQLYIPTAYKPHSLSNPIYVDIGESINKTIDDSSNEFLKRLGVKEMCEQVDIMADIDGKSTIQTEDAVMILLRIIESWKKDEDILSSYKDSAFVLAKEINGDNTTYVVKANECVWNNDVAFFFQNNKDFKYIVAWGDYSALDNNDIEDFRNVFIELGGRTKPYICKAWTSIVNPQRSTLDTNGETDNCRDEDFSLTGIEVISEIAEKKLYAQSKLLWDVIVADKHYGHHQACYQANQRRKFVSLESTLSFYLRRIPWIANKNGGFSRPCDINRDELSDGFVFSEDAVFLKNIGFGDKTKIPNDIVSVLEKAGLKISDYDKEFLGMSAEDKEAFILWRRAHHKEKERVGLSDALNDSNREQIEGEEIDDYGRDISVSNAKARADRQQKEFEEGLEKSVSRKPVLRLTYDSATGQAEKQFISEQYHGKCQICGRPAIVKHNGKQYFQAINIVSTAHLDNALQKSLDAGWNTLCLCPNCAAEYKYCAKNLDTFDEQIDNTEVQNGLNSLIYLNIKLKGELTRIGFTPKHFIALKTAFKVYKTNSDSDK